MKISQACESDKPIIYRMWKEAFAGDDGGSIDHYFAHYYQPSQCWILRDADRIVSSLQVHKHDMFLLGRRIRVSYIVGVVTDPLYRRQGCMRQLLNGVLAILERTELVTILQGYTPEIYEPFGFEKVYRRRRYALNQAQLPVLDAQGLSHTATSAELAQLYRAFTAHFDGYLYRDAAHYTQAAAEIRAQGGQLLYYREDGILRGYGVYYDRTTHLEIDELVYLDSVALLHLLSALAEQRATLLVYLSQNEDLSRLIPAAAYNWQEYMSVRINDLDLYNQCFAMRVTTATEGFNAARQPLWIHDSQ